MKMKGHLYDKMCDKAQIKTSICNAMIGKMSRKEVKAVSENLDWHVDELHRLLTTHSYVPSVPKHKKIWDKCGGKERTISVIPFFPDACVQRLAVDVAKDCVFMARMYPHSCASIPGRGGQHAKKYFEKALRCKNHSTYGLKLDIRKYYPSIKPEVVMKKLEARIKDKDYLNLIHAIITCDPDEPGLSIGFYINQWLANFILEDIDWRIYGQKYVLYYARNMDDMVIVGTVKRELERVGERIGKWLKKEMGLEVKPFYVFKIEEVGLDFVGYRFFHGFTILRRRNSLRLMRRLRRVEKKQRKGQPISFSEASGLLSLIGQLKNVSCRTIEKKYIEGKVDMDELRKIVRKRNGWIERQNNQQVVEPCI